MGLLPLLILELGLRWLGPAPKPLEDDPIFETEDVGSFFRASQKHWEIDPSRLEFFRPDQFLNKKPDRLRRIFVLGGSTVQGRPYETETAFSTWLRLRLQTADPIHDYEVVNCGGVSYASYRLAIVLREVLQHQPDAIVLYTGHNEFLEERSYQTLRKPRPLVDGIVNRSRLLQTLARSMRHAPTQRLSSEVQTRLDQPDGMSLYVRDDEWRDAVVTHFEWNLRRMIAACASANVPLLLCRPVSELVDTAPFKIAPTQLAAEDQPSFETSYRIALDAKLDPATRIEACESCLAIDPHHAGAHYITGRLRLVQGKIDLAREHLLAARDHDVCPLRATTKLLHRLDAVAIETQTPLIQFDGDFDQQHIAGDPIPDGLPDPSRFVDHIHPTIAMHQEIGVIVGDELLRLWQIEPTPDAESEFQSAAAAQMQTLDETYFARGKQRLAGLMNWASGRAAALRAGETTSSLQPE